MAHFGKLSFCSGGNLLSFSEFIVENSNVFVNVIKRKSIPSGYKLVSLDVKSLSTNVPLDQTIEIALKKIFEKQMKRSPAIMYKKSSIPV